MKEIEEKLGKNLKEIGEKCERNLKEIGEGMEQEMEQKWSKNWRNEETFCKRVP